MQQKATGTGYNAPILVCIGLFAIVLVTACSSSEKASAPSSQEATKEPTSTLEPTPSPTMTPTLQPSPTITPLGGSGTLLLEILDTSETCVDACPSLGIFSFDVGSSKLTQVVDEGYRLEAVSPDGDKILISQSERLMVSTPNRSEIIDVANNLSGETGFTRAYWLPGIDTIVFIGQEQGQDFIYSVREDGSDLKKITQKGSDILRLYNTHSNSIIMWEEGLVSNAGIFNQGTWRAKIDGSGLEELENLSSPVFSPKGDRLVTFRLAEIEGVYQPALYIVDAELSGEVKLTHPLEDKQFWCDAWLWIDGGQRLLVQIVTGDPVLDEYHHYLYSASGDLEEEVSIPHDISYLSSVSPDGLQLAFTSVDPGPVYHSYIVDLVTYEVTSLDIGLSEGQSISNMMWLQ